MLTLIGRYKRLLCYMSDEKRITSKHTKTDSSRVVSCVHNFQRNMKRLLKSNLRINQQNVKHIFKCLKCYYSDHVDIGRYCRHLSNQVLVKTITSKM